MNCSAFTELGIKIYDNNTSPSPSTIATLTQSKKKRNITNEVNIMKRKTAILIVIIIIIIINKKFQICGFKYLPMKVVLLVKTLN